MSQSVLPADLLRRWAKASKDGKRALVALGAGQESAQWRLEEAVEALNGVCDEMVEWRERNGAAGSAVAALIEAYCNEASMRHQMCEALSSGEKARGYVAAWKTEPFVNGAAAERARQEMRLLRELEELRDRAH